MAIYQREIIFFATAYSSVNHETKM